MNEPKLRFPEFTGAWEQRKLGDIVPITMGQSPNGNTYSDTPSDYILVQGNADLQNGWVTPRMWTTQVTKKADAGDLIMSVRAPAGAMGKTAYDAVIGRGVAAIKGNEFIYQLLVKMDSDGYWKPLACGSTFESLNSNNIKNANVLIPNTDEQAKIGTCFANLDNLIQSAERELEGYRELKQGMLQKMFPKKGEKVPEIRFPEFTGDWEQCKLSELTDRIIVGLATSVTPYYRETGTPLLRNMNIKENYLDDSDILYLDNEYANSNTGKMIHENDVLTVHTGSNIGLTCVAPKKYNGSLSFTTLITTPTKEKLDSLFLMQYMNCNIGKKRIDVLITAGGKPNLNSGDLEKLEVSYPIVEEQKKIGEYFSNLDNLITLQQKELDGYKELKKRIITADVLLTKRL